MTARHCSGRWAMAGLMRHPARQRCAGHNARCGARSPGGAARVVEDALPELRYLHLVLEETLRPHHRAAAHRAGVPGGHPRLGMKMDRIRTDTADTDANSYSLSDKIFRSNTDTDIIFVSNSDIHHIWIIEM
jgi:hypothetical protein